MNTQDRPPNHAGPAAPGPHDRPDRYEVRVDGHLDARWRAWFDGLDLAVEPDGSTVISGPVADQAALHGLLQKLRDIGIPLVSLAPLPPEPGAEHPTPPTEPIPHDPTGATP